MTDPTGFQRKVAEAIVPPFLDVGREARVNAVATVLAVGGVVDGEAYERVVEDRDDIQRKSHDLVRQLSEVEQQVERLEEVEADTKIRLDERAKWIDELREQGLRNTKDWAEARDAAEQQLAALRAERDEALAALGKKIALMHEPVYDCTGCGKFHRTEYGHPCPWCDAERLREKAAEAEADINSLAGIIQHNDPHVWNSDDGGCVDHGAALTTQLIKRIIGRAALREGASDPDDRHPAYRSSKYGDSP